LELVGDCIGLGLEILLLRVKVPEVLMVVEDLGVEAVGVELGLMGEPDYSYPNLQCHPQVFEEVS
jgi:hypothetical protein